MPKKRIKEDCESCMTRWRESVNSGCVTHKRARELNTKNRENCWLVKNVKGRIEKKSKKKKKGYCNLDLSC